MKNSTGIISPSVNPFRASRIVARHAPEEKRKVENFMSSDTSTPSCPQTKAPVHQTGSVIKGVPKKRNLIMTGPAVRRNRLQGRTSLMGKGEGTVGDGGS